MPQFPSNLNASGIWTLKKQKRAVQGRNWPPLNGVDPQFNYVTMLLHGNGTNGAQNNTFLDSSTNNFTITRNGNTTQGTFSPYGTRWSQYGVDTDSIILNQTSATDLGSGSFTLEAFFLSSTGLNIISKRKSDGPRTGSYILATGPSSIYFADVVDSPVAAISITGLSIPANAWNHIAVVRSGTNISIFLNGTRVYNNTNYTYDFTCSSWAYIGAHSNGGGEYPGGSGLNGGGTGYRSNLRIVQGVAVYNPANTTITVPTEPLTAVTGTTLLMFRDNRYDSTSPAVSFSRYNSPSIQPMGPFGTSGEYSSSTIGGSGYFDGSGDFLTWTGTAAGSGAFSYEFWIYSTNGFATMRAPLGVIAISGYNSALDIRMTGSTINVSQYNVATNNFTVPALQANTWYHIVACRDASNNTTVFVNGVRSSTGAITLATNFSGLTSAIGRLDPSNGGDVTGYISGVRLITGSTPYDPTQTTITVPTAPPTAITNTQLLANFTNGGIIDNAMMNDLETVGNAQISTSVSKFGGGSLAFDGTGDWLFAPSSPNFALLTGDFTIEMWAYFNNTASTAFFDMRGVGGGSPNNPVFTWSATASTVQAYLNDGYRITSGTLSTGQWYHIALVRSGTTATMYINGVSAGTYTYSTSVAQQALYVGTGYGLGSWNGYIDDLRITKAARYVANFTPPTAPFPDQ